jgi:hypothetical protein
VGGLWISVADEARADRLLAALLAPDLSDGSEADQGDGDVYCPPAAEMMRLREIDAALVELVPIRAAGSAGGRYGGWSTEALRPQPTTDHVAAMVSPGKRGAGAVMPWDEDYLTDMRQQKYAPPSYHHQ